MNLEILRQLRNILLRTALVSLGLSIFMAVATALFWTPWSTLASTLFHTTPDELGPIVVNFFAFVKFFAIFVLIAPALAIHWTINTKA